MAEKFRDVNVLILSSSEMSALASLLYDVVGGSEILRAPNHVEAWREIQSKF